MAYTAAALSYMIQNSAKPVVLTGSQKSIYNRDTDARNNLYRTFLYASSDFAWGVQLVFDNKVILGTRARKTSGLQDCGASVLEAQGLLERHNAVIIHAGDLTSEMDYEHLCTIAPVRAVLGNNDYYRDYGPDVDRLAIFTYEGLKFAVAHYREDLPVGFVDVAINGHTHVTKEAQVGRCLVLNPGSASYPRGTRGPTMARMLVKDGKIINTKFIDLE